MRLPPILLALLFLTGWLPALQAATFDEANGAFAAGDYAKATSALQELITREGPSSARLFNLGNAHARLNQYGPAILCYERAALLAPRDPDIQANLRLARGAAGSADGAAPRPWWESILHACSLREWSWITAAGAAVLGSLSLLWGITGFPRLRLRQSAAAGLIMALAATSLGGTALWQRRGEANLAIITAAEPVLRLSPFPEAGATGSPGTGRRVLTGTRSRGWVYLTVPGSTMGGWLPDNDVASLLP